MSEDYRSKACEPHAVQWTAPSEVRLAEVDQWIPVAQLRVKEPAAHAKNKVVRTIKGRVGGPTIEKRCAL